LNTLNILTGSSAGAGSGDFHVYRGVRRREYARQKYLDEKFEKVSTTIIFIGHYTKYSNIITIILLCS
jgi:hypothetical protein